MSDPAPAGLELSLRNASNDCNLPCLRLHHIHPVVTFLGSFEGRSLGSIAEKFVLLLLPLANILPIDT